MKLICFACAGQIYDNQKGGVKSKRTVEKHALNTVIRKVYLIKAPINYLN